MKRLSRILGSAGGYWMIGGLALIGHTILVTQAIMGEELALYLLAGLFYVWTALAILNGVGRRRSLEGWEHSLDAWDETQKLARDYALLLVESCRELSNWDRERAEEIAGRAETIGLLRQQNFDERMSK